MRLQNTFIDKQQSLLSDSQSYTNEVQCKLNHNVQALCDRVGLVKGQSARLAAVEATIQQSVNNSTIVPPHSQPILSVGSTQAPPVSVPNILTSTIQPGGTSARDLFQANNSSIPIMNMNSYYCNNVSRFSNTSGITLDYTRIPNYDGNLMSIHPDGF